MIMAAVCIVAVLIVLYILSSSRCEYYVYKDKTDTEDNVEKKYEEAVASLPEDKQQAVREYCDAIFDSGAESEIFFYRLGLQDGIRLNKIVKKIIRSVS